MINLYTLYHFAEGIYTGLSRHLPGGFALPPLQLVIELTYRCNLKCKMCYIQNQISDRQLEATNPNEEPSLTDIRRIIDQTPPWCLIIFTGGEPFARTDTIQILQYATRKRRCHLVTNGTLITQDMARNLVDLGLLSIGFSIDGDAHTHDQVRGIAGSYERTMRTVHAVREYRLAQGRRLPLINLKTVITQSNVNQLDKIAGIAQEIGADYCTFQIVNQSLWISGIDPQDEMQVFQSSPAPIANFDSNVLEKQLATLAQMSGLNGTQIRFLPAFSSQEILAHYSNRFDVRDYSCGTPWSGINVSTQGVVFPCFNYRAGDLSTESLASVWNGKRYRAFRQSLKRDGLWAGCVGCCDLDHRKMQFR